MQHTELPLATLAVALASSTVADWSNLDGNERANGLVAVIAPTAARKIWSRTNLPSLNAWPRSVDGDRIVTVHQTQTQAQNPFVGPGDSIVRCIRLSTGASL